MSIVSALSLWYSVVFCFCSLSRLIHPLMVNEWAYHSPKWGHPAKRCPPWNLSLVLIDPKVIDHGL